MPTSFESFSEEIRPRRLVDGPPTGAAPPPGPTRPVRRWAAAAAGALWCRRRGLTPAVAPVQAPGSRR